MSIAAWFVLALAVIILTLVVANKIRVDLAALVIAVALGMAQFAGLSVLGETGKTDSVVKAISGFSQPVVITLLSLFIITRCLEKTGVTRIIATTCCASAATPRSASSRCSPPPPPWSRSL